MKLADLINDRIDTKDVPSPIRKPLADLYAAIDGLGKAEKDAVTDSALAERIARLPAWAKARVVERMKAQVK
jgi:hypothetical protein